MTHGGHPLVGWKNHGWVLSVVLESVVRRVGP